MRIRTLSIFGLAVAAVLGLAACSEPEPAATPPATAQAAPNPLHWDESKPPAKLDELRRDVEEIGFALSQDGFSPSSESVDNPSDPTALITQWLKSDTIVELHSHLGVTAISFYREVPGTPDPSGKQWIRCAAGTGLHGDVIAEVKSLQRMKTAELGDANACHGVTWTLPKKA